MLVLTGIAVVVIGFALRINPLLVVALAALVTGLAGGLDLFAVVSLLGKAFADNRMIAIAWLVLPVIGLLERGGIRERARTLIQRFTGATAGRVLSFYFVVRQLASTLGLTALGGHVQMVRPLIAPMAEAAASRDKPLDEETRNRIRANAAAVDNIALFFGEDVFIAVGSILLIRGFLAQFHIDVAPMSLAVWAIPTAVTALVVHVTRLWLLDRRLKERR